MIMKTSHTIYASFAKRTAIILTLLLTLGVTQVWGALSSPSACVFTSSSSTSLSDDNTDVTWIASTKPSGFESSGDKRGLQWSGSVVNGGLTLSCSSYSSYTITKIEVVWSRNNGAGASVSATVGGKSFGSSDTNNAKTTNRTATFTGSEKGDIVIKATSTATNNSFYIKSITVSYEDVASCTYIVQFDSNGGTGTMSDQTFTCDVRKQLTPNSFSRTGHTFAGWNTEANGSGDSYSNQQSVSNLAANGETITLFAQWTANKYIVKFYANGGTGTMDDQNFTYGTAQNLTPNAFEKYGHTFAGWSKTSNGSIIYTDGQSVNNLASTNNATVDLYAQWTEKDLTNYRTTCSTKADPNLSWSASTCIATMEVDNEFPTLTNPYELSITYLSSDPTVATIDENGTITLLKSGTTTITASYEEDEDYLSASTSYELTVEAANCKWVETEIGDIESGDEVVIAMEKKGDINVLTYALADNNTAAKEAPLATEISINANKTINTDITPISTPLIWNIDYDKEGTKNLVIYSTRNVGKWLYSNDANDGVRIGDNTNKEFKIVKGIGDDAENSFLYHVAQNRYLGVYYTENDWRGYTLTDKGAFPNNIKGQTLKFYKKECIASDEYWIIYNLENVTCNSEMPNYIGTDGEIELYFSANSGYKLPEQVSITMGGLPLSEEAFAWEAEEGILYIVPDDGITGDIVITVEGCELLAIPTNLKANNITSSSATLSWDEIDHATEYQVHITDDDDSTEDIITTTSNTYYEVTGLSSASEYLWGITPIASGYCGLTQEAEIFTTLDVYTVTFNSNGGTAVEPQTVDVDAGSKITAPANPSAAGYTFNYWYTTDANVPFDFNTPITGNTTLNAKWTPNVYTITFYKQSGTGGTDNATVTFNSNNYSVSTIEAPTRDKYAFGGYYTEQHGAGIQVVDADGNWLKNKTGYLDASGNWIKAESINLYAKWTKIHTITWVVNNNTETPHHTSTALDGSTIDALPMPPADDLFEDCDVNAFVGWSTDNIGLEPDPTAPTDLFKTLSEAQSKIGTINGDKKFYAVYASEIEQIATFEADGLNGLSANSTLKWTHNNSGISLAISAGQRYTGSPKTFTITNGTSNYCEIVAPEGKSLKKAVVSITGSNYKVNSVSSPWALSTSSITQTITTSTNATDLKMYATSSYQIRITQVDVTYTTYSNYITRCTALPDPVWGGATIDKTEIAVNCGETSSTNGAAKISFLKETNFNLYKDITIEVTSGNFIIASSRDGEYSTSVTLTPTQSGTNVGTLDGKYVYVRAVAPPMSSDQLTGTITISGKQIATQVINVTATVTCNEYTLTFNDCGDTKTITDFSGTSVEEMEPWAEICSEPVQYVFDGWATAPVTNGTEEYGKVDFSTFTMPNNNTTILYAVYRYAEEGGEPVNGYVKVTEALTDWSGDYVIVNETAKKAIKSEYKTNTSSNKTLMAEDVTLNNNMVVSPSEDVIWQIRKKGNYYTMYNETAKKYAYITQGKSEAAGLDDNPQDLMISFNNSNATIYSETYSRCFSYYNTNIEWRTYSTQNYSTGALYRLSEKSIRYTSSLVCGSIEAENAMVTSTVGQIVKVNVPITLNYSEAASITGTSDNEAFTVVTKNDVAVGESNIEVHYKPTAYVNTANQEETATITLTTSNAATTTFNITGRCLPETFAIVAKVGNVWYALPSQGLNSETTPVGYPVEVDNNDNPTAVTAVPANADWSLRQVYASSGSNDRFTANGENLVFVNAENNTLYANNGNANIQTFAEYSNYAKNNPDRYEWVPTTTDLTNYTLKNVGRNKELSINVNTTFGTHASNIASNNLRFLPINATYNPFDMQVVEWYPTKVLVQTEAALTSVSATVGGVAVANPGVTKKGGKLYEISGLPLENNPTKILTISYDSYSCSKVIPIIISRATKSVTDAPFNTLTTSAYNYSDLIVRDGATLTINGTKQAPDKFVNVTIYPTAKIVVPENKQLSVYSLTFFGGIDDIYDGEKYTTNKYGVPQLSLKGTLGKTVTTMDYIMRVNLDQMYQVGVPYDVNLGEITYWDGSAIRLGNELYVSAYDGQARANLDMNNTWRWEVNFAEKVLKAGVGYTISAEPQVENDDYSILRMPMKSNISSGDTEASKQVPVIAYANQHSVQIAENHKGWNYLSNPYMTAISGGEADSELVLGYLKETGTGPWEWVNDEIRYVTIPHDDGEDYYQKKFSEAVLKPFKSFFVQIATDGELSFALTSRQNAPARYMEVQTEQEVEFEILLSNDKQSDNTGLLIAEQYSPAYEINADLEKMIGSMSVYTIYGGYNLAYNAISPINASEWIPMGYIAPAAGEYTFRLDDIDKIVEQVEHVYLIDYDANNIVDLMDDEYEFTTDKEQNNNRFAINIVLIQDKDNTTTGMDIINGNVAAPIKFIYHDKMYIQSGGVIYDGTGKQVININK